MSDGTERAEFVVQDVVDAYTWRDLGPTWPDFNGAMNYLNFAREYDTERSRFRIVRRETRIIEEVVA